MPLPAGRRLRVDPVLWELPHLTVPPVARGCDRAALRELHPKTSDGRGLTTNEISAHSIGVEVVGGRFSLVIKTGTILGCRARGTFKTVLDVGVNIFEGDDESIDRCTLLSRRPGGRVHFKVEVKIDANGVLHFRVRDREARRNIVTEMINTVTQQYPVATKVMEYITRNIGGVVLSPESLTMVENNSGWSGFSY
jgi:molecular chaperone DnaK (HSP70)